MAQSEPKTISNSKTKNLKTMKSHTFIFTALITLLILSCIGCEDNYSPEEQKPSISVEFIRSKVKSQDETEDNTELIELKGTVVDQNETPVQSEVELYLNPEMELIENCQTDEAGCFSFEVNANREYRLLVLKDGNLLGDKIIMAE